MRRLKTYLLAAVACLCLMKAQAQQTVQFSQYMFNGLALNPAYAGYKEDWTLNLASRIQWVGINDAPQTGTISVDGLTNNTDKNMGVGMLVTFDRLGPENTTSAYLNYSYRLQLDAEDTKRLCFGIGLGGEQYSINGAKFSATDVGDGVIPLGVESKITPDVRFGVYYYSPSFYFGASAFNLLSSAGIASIDNLTVVQNVRTIYTTMGMMLPLSDHVDIKPSIMVKSDLKGPLNFDATSYLVFNQAVWLGASYRSGVAVWNQANLKNIEDNNDAISAIMQIYLNEHFRIGYAFDFTTSKLANYQNGTHELSLSITFPSRKPRVLSPRYF